MFLPVRARCRGPSDRCSLPRRWRVLVPGNVCELASSRCRSHRRDALRRRADRCTCTGAGPDRQLSGERRTFRQPTVRHIRAGGRQRQWLALCERHSPARRCRSGGSLHGLGAVRADPPRGRRARGDRERRISLARARRLGDQRRRRHVQPIRRVQQWRVVGVRLLARGRPRGRGHSSERDRRPARSIRPSAPCGSAPTSSTARRVARSSWTSVPRSSCSARPPRPVTPARSAAAGRRYAPRARPTT